MTMVAHWSERSVRRYERWLKKKGKKKTDKDKERQYAVKTAKKEKTVKLVVEAVAKAIAAGASAEDATSLVESEAKKAIAEDMTGAHCGNCHALSLLPSWPLS